MFQSAQKYLNEKDVIDRALRIATSNHDTHIPKTEKKYQEARKWFEDVSKEQQESLQHMERDLQQLASIPARTEFLQFISVGQNSDLNNPHASTGQNVSLREFFDGQDIQQAITTSKKVSRRFGTRIAEMGSNIEKVSAEYNNLVGTFAAQSQSRSSVEDDEHMTGSKMMHEIEVVAKKVSSDYEHILGLPPNQKSIPQTSKLALLHTRNYLPAMKEVSAEISAFMRRSIEQKNVAARKAVESMQTIASIESMLTSVNKDIDSLEFPADGLEAFEIVAMVGRLPFVYGSLLVESIRRNDWSEKMKRDSSTLADEMAGYQEEEEKRRKRWIKSIGDALNVDAIQSKVLSFEINVKGEEGRWPEVSRQELSDYIRLLRGFKDMDETIESLNSAMKDLDRPSKQQVKRAKNFKNGSVHETAFGKGSGLILRGEEEVRALRESNTKLEEDLKASKSRVRKLEDLVHRQSQTSRFSIGSGFPTHSGQIQEASFPPDLQMAASPRLHDDHSRRSSISSRRFSVTQQTDQQQLMRRVMELEAEVSAEKEARSNAEQDVAAQKIANDDLQRQIVEANSTKKDLLENLEAQQKEFANERRSIEEELTKYKIRVEEMEDEFERVLGSRDNERSGIDTRMRTLEDELEMARKEATEEIQKAHIEIENLKTTLDERDQVDADQYDRLCEVFTHLSNMRAKAPADTDDLVAKLEELAQQTAEQVKELQEAIAIAKSENDVIRANAETFGSETAAQNEKYETQIRKMEEDLEMSRAKAESLAVELEDERGHLHDLRAKFADGETGAEALRQRVTEEETKVLQLTSRLAEAKSHTNGLDVELLSLQKKYERLQSSTQDDATKLRDRSLRAKDLSERLFSQKERLLRLLETLGYAISYPDGQMIVTRISKTTGNSTILPGNPERRVSMPSPTKPTTTSSIAVASDIETVDLSFLQWTESMNDADENAKYEALLSALARLNLDTFTEAILKRVKDYEHTARKWQKEARAYRDRSHKYQSDSHDKIAFRSFKEGDLALFLPTRNQATRPWAAFNVGAPHYFLREQEGFRLRGREWLVARITKVEERIVDLSKGMGGETHSEGGASYEDDNPFELSDGLRWYLLDASEERPGAPSTPGLGKTTVASTHIEAKANVRAIMSPPVSKSRDIKGKDDVPKESQAAKTLNKSLESRRSSQGSRKSFVASINPLRGSGSNEALAGDGDGKPQRPSHLRSSSQASVFTSPGADEIAGTGSGLKPQPAQAGRPQVAGGSGGEEVRKDLLWGP